MSHFYPNNQLSSDGVYNYTYDHEGNVETRTKISDSSFTLYTWDYRNRLVSVTSKTSSSGSVTQKINYTYDVFDRMVGRDVDSDGDTDIDVADRYIYDGGEIVLSLAANGDVKQRMLWGPGTDMALADENSSAEVYWTLGDQQNSIRGWAVYYDHLIGDVNGDDVVNQLDIDTVTGNWLMTSATLANGDANGDGVVNQLDLNMVFSNWLGTGDDSTLLAGSANYNAFGKGTTPTNIDILPIGYTGKFYDIATSLQYNLARWYDSSTGRWISEDPIGFAGDPSNLYRYVENGPTNGVDPSGLFMEGEDDPGKMDLDGDGIFDAYDGDGDGKPEAWFRPDGNFQLWPIDRKELVRFFNNLTPAEQRDLLNDPAFRRQVGSHPLDCNRVYDDMERLTNVLMQQLNDGMIIWLGTAAVGTTAATAVVLFPEVLIVEVIVASGPWVEKQIENTKLFIEELPPIRLEGSDWWGSGWFGQ